MGEMSKLDQIAAAFLWFEDCAREIVIGPDANDYLDQAHAKSSYESYLADIERDPEMRSLVEEYREWAAIWYIAYSTTLEARKIGFRLGLIENWVKEARQTGLMGGLDGSSTS